MRTASPGPRGPLVWPQAAAWRQSNGGMIISGPRYASPGPRAIPSMDSQVLHRQGYTSPAPRQSPQRRSSSPATGHSHYQHTVHARVVPPELDRDVQRGMVSPVNLQSVPSREHSARKPIARAVPVPTEPAMSLREADVPLPQKPLPQDQVSYYRGQVQDLKHAIQAHASSMGLQVSAIMDRCVTESNLASDNLLLQVTTVPPG